MIKQFKLLKKKLKRTIKNSFQKGKNRFIISKLILKKKILKKVIPDGFYLSMQGCCPCCDQQVVFESYDPWLRDNFRCSNCYCIPRERALAKIIEKYYPGWRELDIHESSPGYWGASKKLKDNCKKYISSQFYPASPFGTLINNERNEDLEKQTFPDCSFDLVVTQNRVTIFFRILKDNYYPNPRICF